MKLLHGLQFSDGGYTNKQTVHLQKQKQEYAFHHASFSTFLVADEFIKWIQYRGNKQFGFTKSVSEPIPIQTATKIM